jgi:hypothetical protein
MKPREAAIAAMYPSASESRDRRYAQRQRAPCGGVQHPCRMAARDRRTTRASRRVACVNLFLRLTAGNTAISNSISARIMLVR